jgi:hypothetical protein
MMEIDITRFFNESEPFEYSASIAERGVNAGRDTWNNARDEGSRSPLLTTAEQLAALREYVKGFGAWDAAEIAAWDDSECNALFIQLVAGDMREMESLCMGDDGEIDWNEHESLASQGTISGNLYRGDNGRVYYYLGS